MTRVLSLTLALSLVAISSATASAGVHEEELDFKSFDKFVLPAKIARPDTQKKDSDVKRVIILIHGSGPQNMDSDLTIAGTGKKILVFKELSGALVGKGFTVIRYDKRGYVWKKAIMKDAKVLKSNKFKAAGKHPLKDLVGDVKAWVKYAKKRFKNAKLHLLGHSQGTFIALQVARMIPEVKGVALIGFMGHSIDLHTFEQIVYRSLGDFDGLDADRNGSVSKDELAKGGQKGAALIPQMPALDFDNDGSLSRMEFKAAMHVGLMQFKLPMEYIRDEASYPRVEHVIAKAKFKVAFFQGLWDNQTPPETVIAIKLAAEHHWKLAKDRIQFNFYPKLGHALDLRTSYHSVTFAPMDAKAKADLADKLNKFFP